MDHSHIVRQSLLLILIAGIFASCSDSSRDSDSVALVSSNSPVITRIEPDSVMTGDTLKIFGHDFGERQGANPLMVGGQGAVPILSWSDTVLSVIVPDGAASGTVNVTVVGHTSNSVPIIILPHPVQISYLNNVRPIFLLNNCINCHGGSNNLYVGTVAQLLQGGAHGPAVVPGIADSSLLLQKISPVPPFGERMPQYGPYLSDSLVTIIRTWINQGAKDN
jgi:hypothetical protein